MSASESFGEKKLEIEDACSEIVRYATRSTLRETQQCLPGQPGCCNERMNLCKDSLARDSIRPDDANALASTNSSDTSMSQDTSSDTAHCIAEGNCDTRNVPAAGENIRWGRANLVIVGKETSAICALLNRFLNANHGLITEDDYAQDRIDQGEPNLNHKNRPTSIPYNHTQRESTIARENYRTLGASSFSSIKKEDCTPHEDINFRICDYGGQEVFCALHHMFLTQYGAYVLVFDMREVLDRGRPAEPSVEKGDESLRPREDALQALQFWIDSIHLHVPKANVALVGTHLHQISDVDDHKAISMTLMDELRFSKECELDLLQNGDEELQFFPIDITDQDDQGKHISHLCKALSKAVGEKGYVKDKIPSWWFDCLRELVSQNEDILKLDAVEEILLEKCPDVHSMLAYMHRVGVLVHLTACQADVLRQYVVVRPQGLLQILSKVICEPSRKTAHADNLQYGEGIPNNLRWALKAWKERGVASRDLLKWLWEGKPLDYLIELMKSFMMACPWDDEELGPDSLLLPSLLQSVGDEKKKKALEKLSTQRVLAYIEFAILPKGLFQRFIANLVQSLPDLVGVVNSDIFSNFASIYFDNVYMVLETKGNRVMLYFKRCEGKSLANHVKVLKRCLDSINSSSVKGDLFLSSDGTDEKDACASVDAFESADTNDIQSLQPGKRLLLSAFAPFVENCEGLKRVHPSLSEKAKTYDVFLSHAWGKDEAIHEKVKAVADALKERNISSWVDGKNVKSLLLDSIAEGIEESKAFVVFVTREYMDKVNDKGARPNYCRAEFNYAYMQVGSAKMIPCILDDEMLDQSNWKGPFGIRWDGPRLHVPMPQGGEPDEVDALAQEIKAVLDLQIPMPQQGEPDEVDAPAQEIKTVHDLQAPMPQQGEPDEVDAPAQEIKTVHDLQVPMPQQGEPDEVDAPAQEIKTVHDLQVPMPQQGEPDEVDAPAQEIKTVHDLQKELEKPSEASTFEHGDNTEGTKTLSDSEVDAMASQKKKKPRWLTCLKRTIMLKIMDMNQTFGRRRETTRKMIKARAHAETNKG